MASEPEADGEADFIQSRRIKGRLCRWGQRFGCVSTGQRAETASMCDPVR